MGLKIVDLLRWKKSIILKDESDKILLDEKGNPVTIYMRVVGDQDLQDAFKLARVRSAEKRKTLRDETSLEYLDQVAPIKEASREDCMELILTARTQTFQSEAYANVERPDAVTIEEIAADPDAVSLEEQEQLDAANEKVDKEYVDAIQTYIETRQKETEVELESISLENIRGIAELEVSNITSLALFLQEVLDYKIIKACYTNKALTEKAFDSVEEYRSANSHIKAQISEAYMRLEIGADEIKN